MDKREKSSGKQLPKRKDAEQAQKRAKDIGPPKQKAEEVKGGAFRAKY